MKALILIDWQNEYVDSNSDYYVGSDLKEQVSKLNNTIRQFRDDNSLIIIIKHNELEGENFLEGSYNSNLIEVIDKKSEDITINKYKISSFYQTNLEDILKENSITDLYVTGILTNLCVRSFISDAYDRDYNINIIKDLCITFNNEIQEFTLKDLKETRPEINILDSNN